MRNAECEVRNRGRSSKFHPHLRNGGDRCSAVPSGLMRVGVVTQLLSVVPLGLQRAFVNSTKSMPGGVEGIKSSGVEAVADCKTSFAGSAGGKFSVISLICVTC